MTTRFLKDLIRKYPEDSKKFQGNNPKCMKIDLINPGVGNDKQGRLEIYLDDNSQSIFNESI